MLKNYMMEGSEDITNSIDMMQQEVQRVPPSEGDGEWPPWEGGREGVYHWGRVGTT